MCVHRVKKEKPSKIQRAISPENRTDIRKQSSTGERTVQNYEKTKTT